MDIRKSMREAKTRQLTELIRRIFEKHISARAPERIDCVSDALSEQLQETMGRLERLPASELRHVYDAVGKMCVKSVELACLGSFMRSPHYQYILALKEKEHAPVSMESFMAVRLLGKGGFGQVVEVVKRDCQKHYAMKVMKRLVKPVPEDEQDWVNMVMLERRLLGGLHHPLLVNLAYAFQATQFVTLVMDTCPGGDLARFVLTDATLDSSQIHFVAMEVCRTAASGSARPAFRTAALSPAAPPFGQVAVIIGFLHSRFVLYRDLKPENLLLDPAGHVRLVDFGLAVVGDAVSGLPKHTGQHGTVPYFAPEVVRCKSDAMASYSGSVDWWCMGVLLYELAEKDYPFGMRPQFREYSSFERDFLEPTRTARSDRPLRDLICSLLRWEVMGRLGCTGGLREVRQHYYWSADERGEPDWELVEQGRATSPLASLVAEYRAPDPADENAADKKRDAELYAVDMAVKLKRAAQGDKKLADADFQNKILPEWEFVSKEAIAQEYIQSLAWCVSLV